MDTSARPASAPLQGTESAKNAVARVTYTHDAMIDLILACPGVSQNQIAAHFGFTAAWVSRIRNSDAFLARLATRKADLVDPVLIESIEEKLRAIVSESADIIIDKLATTRSVDMAFKGLDVAGKLAGYGARSVAPVVQNNFVVALPAKAASEAEWAAAHRPASGAIVADAVEVPPKTGTEG